MVATNENVLINGIAAKLEAQYDCEIHATALRQGFEAPCFFIELISGSGRRIGFRRHERRHSFCIHYFPKGVFDEDAEAFNQEIYTVADELYQVLEYIQVNDHIVNGRPIRCTGSNMHHDTSDGVLHFFVDYNYHLIEERPGPKMESLAHTALPASMKGVQV